MNKKFVKSLLTSAIVLGAVASPVAAFAQDFDSLIGATEAQINGLSAAQAELYAQLNASYEKLNQVQAEATTLQATIEEQDQAISALKAEIKDLEAAIAKRESLLADQARAVQANGGAANYVNVVASSKSVSDFVGRVDVVKKMVTANKSLLGQQKADKEAVEVKKATVEATKEDNVKKQVALEALKGALTEEQANNEAVYNQLTSDLSLAQENRAALIAEKEAYEAQQAAIQLAAQQAAAQAAQEAAAQQAAYEAQQAQAAQVAQAATTEQQAQGQQVAPATPAEQPVVAEGQAQSVAQPVAETPAQPTQPVQAENGEVPAQPAEVASETPVAPAAQPEVAAGQTQSTVETPAQPVAEQPAPAVETPAQPVAEQPAPAVETPAQPVAETPAPAVETPAASTYGDVLATAAKYVGTPYVWGGKSTSGFDCSGFVQYVYKEAFGKDVGSWTVPQESAGTKISVADAQPGDLYFWGEPGSTYHVAIATGNGQFIHASQPGTPLGYNNINNFTPSFAVRVQ